MRTKSCTTTTNDSRPKTSTRWRACLTNQIRSLGLHTPPSTSTPIFAIFLTKCTTLATDLFGQYKVVFSFGGINKFPH